MSHTPRMDSVACDPVLTLAEGRTLEHELGCAIRSWDEERLRALRESKRVVLLRLAVEPVLDCYFKKNREGLLEAMLVLSDAYKNSWFKPNPLAGAPETGAAM